MIASALRARSKTASSSCCCSSVIAFFRLGSGHRLLLLVSSVSKSGRAACAGRLRLTNSMRTPIQRSQLARRRSKGE